MTTPAPLDPEDVKDPETGLTPREAAHNILRRQFSLLNADAISELVERMLCDSWECAMICGAVEDDAADWDKLRESEIPTLRRWHASRVPSPPTADRLAKAMDAAGCYVLADGQAMNLGDMIQAGESLDAARLQGSQDVGSELP